MRFGFKAYILFLILIIFLGIGLCWANLSTAPRHGATFDEFAWTWLGINLIQNQTPVSWSSQPQYNTKCVCCFKFS